MKLGIAVAAALVACKPEPAAPPVPPPPTPAPVTPVVAATPPDAAPDSPRGPATCTEEPFAESTPIAEASGATWLTIDGKRMLVVLSDGGHQGDYALVDPDTGTTTERGKLPLGSPDCDLEGIAARGDQLYAVTSPGWVRSWKRTAKGFQLVDKPYGLGPNDLPNKKGGLGNVPPVTDGMVCAPEFTNCGRNYEGICLVPDQTGADSDLAGFVAAKADGHLYGLRMIAGKLAVDRTIKIKVAEPGLIADCTFDTDGTLLVGGNSFDVGGIHRVDHWQTPTTATVTRVATLLVGFPEVVALDGDVVYRMSDTGRAPSLMKKYRCAGIRP